MLHSLSQVIWFALAILVVTGIGLYLPESGRLNESPKFLMKLIVVSVLIINGSFLNLLVTPKLVRISFGAPHDHEPGELTVARRLALAMGAISIVSWYSAFFLGYFDKAPAEFSMMIAIYIGLLAIGVVVSQILEHKLVRLSRPSS